MEKSWLPVPRRPSTRHVSRIVALFAGTQNIRANAAPAGVRIGSSPSQTTQGAMSQRA